MTDPIRILVVDDEPRGVELLVRTLRSLGRVETALSAEEAWEITRQVRFDCVISDQRMTGMSGVEFLARVAEQREDTGRILLTGYADLATAIDAINRSRIHAYLPKPSPPDDVQITVRSVLERVRLMRENARLIGDLSQRNQALEEALRSLEEAQQRVVASERLAAIGQMIAMIVHDLRSPLTAIRSSSAEVIRHGENAGSAEVGELGSEIVAETERMQRMCSELLEVTRASEGRSSRVGKEFDEALATAMAQVTDEASRAGVRVELHLGCASIVAIDEDRLRRALINLAYNAIEAMPGGGVLRVESGCEGGAAIVSVIDSGSGIPDEIRDRLFDPFVTAGKPGGCGLGLAVVKKVIDDHRGSIEVGKPEGGGTAFHLRIPMGPAE